MWQLCLNFSRHLHAVPTAAPVCAPTGRARGALAPRRRRVCRLVDDGRSDRRGEELAVVLIDVSLTTGGVEREIFILFGCRLLSGTSLADTVSPAVGRLSFRVVGS